jgi:hypothetical protein
MQGAKDDAASDIVQKYRMNTKQNDDVERYRLILVVVEHSIENIMQQSSHLSRYGIFPSTLLILVTRSATRDMHRQPELVGSSNEMKDAIVNGGENVHKIHH